MRLLIIGQLDGHVGIASVIAARQGAAISHVQTLDDALSFLRDGKGAELALIDMNLDVEDFLSCLKIERISIPVVVCGTGDDDREKAVAAIKAGAKEYLPLPPDEELIAAILRALSTEEESDVIIASDVMKSIMSMVDKIAPTKATVLLTGESGTGKEVIAKAIHKKSTCAAKPFVSVNCAAIPEALLESELFGHEKGAFTGAIARRIGKFEEANHTTLFLDEISEMDLKLQAKLLRAIQEKEITRVGGNQSIKLDIRIIATSNRKLMDEVRAGRFREDLFYRLNTIVIELPPLRQRKEDILVLAGFFVKAFSKLNGLQERVLSEGALEKLMAYQWPGNVRELENTLHRVVVLASGVVIEPSMISFMSEQLSSSDDDDDVSSLVGRSMASVEQELILKTLDSCYGNRTHAATILGISIRTLRNKLRLYQDDGVSVPLPQGVGA